MWNWKDAVMFRRQAPVIEDVDPLVIVNTNSRRDVSFVDEKWTSYGKEKDRPGWRVSEQALDTESILDSDSEDYHSSDDDMTVAGSDFSDDGSKEPYIIIHFNEDANLHQKFAAIDFSPGRLKYRDRHEIHQLEDKISRWSTLLNDERQLIQGIAEWLESLIPYNIWDVSPCGQPSRVPSICSATSSSCPLCLIRCLKPYPEWSFLFPILEESANRLATGVYAMRDLNDNLIAIDPEEFWRGEDSFSSEFNNEILPARHPCNIPEPPPPQRLTRKMETQISEAELRVSNMNAGVIAMNQSTILPG
ncbi:uncharacterized protein PAC_11674 [Phialocephala subalpina]|uniref:Uncharacterized protein n=1 Tax=Phialocephala subalpina TaxID=576137 RepID=A0A1L7X9X3_9HELO|nr:uncharacterized protein PAC_11674 [Phialocephala subalpina]